MSRGRVYRYCIHCKSTDLKKRGVNHPLYWCMRCGRPDSACVYLPELMAQAERRESGKTRQVQVR